jgi:hypothetical protein
MAFFRSDRGLRRAVTVVVRLDRKSQSLNSTQLGYKQFTLSIRPDELFKAIHMYETSRLQVALYGRTKSL